MQVKIVRPFAADKEVGETEQHYGVTFKVTENSSKHSVLVADLPEEDAAAMIKAGRVEAVTDHQKESDEVTMDDMKAYLSERGVDFPANIRADKLAELYQTEKAKE